MKVELEKHVGVMPSGVQVEFDQFRVFATGPDGNRVLVGYLSFDEKLPLMLVCNQPANVLKELIEKCSAITKRTVLSPIPIVEPPEIDNTAGEDYEDDDDN
jgi:hypothetical protein